MIHETSRLKAVRSRDLYSQTMSRYAADQQLLKLHNIISWLHAVYVKHCHISHIIVLNGYKYK